MNIPFLRPDDTIVTDRVFVISDTHWFHDNIIRYCQRRPDHDDQMVECWNAVVSDSDIVLHLGDLMLGKRDRFEDEVAPILNGRKFLIKGNHDKQSNVWYASVGFPVIAPFSGTYNGVTIHFSHYPLDDKHPKHVNIHGHIHRGEHHRGTTDPSAGFRNVGVEVMDYTPYPLDALLREATR